MVEKMKCFYQELDRRKKYLITKLNDEIATLEWQWFQREISDKDYYQQGYQTTLEISTAYQIAWYRFVIIKIRAEPV